MKKYTFILSLSAIVVLSSCDNTAKDSEEPKKEDTTEKSITDSALTTIDTSAIDLLKVDGEFDFGTIDQGDTVNHSFTITNMADEPMIITHAKASCGCTVAEKPEDPIQPGDSTTIAVSFDSSNKSGVITKRVRLMTNLSDEPYFLTLRGKVVVNN